MTETGLRARHVSVNYARRTVLHDLNPAPFPRGRVCALLGPNGSGKSTFLRAVAGIVPSPAIITLNGMELSRMPLAQRTRHCIYLPQALPAPVHLQVLESLIAAHHVNGMPGVADTNIIDEALEILATFGIEDLAMRYMDELSGGQRQLVGLAQAMGRHPDALLLDEPLSALDLHHQFSVMKIIHQATITRGLVTMVVLHDLNIAARMTDDAIVMRDGRLIAAGPTRTVISPELLQQTYGIHARVETCSRGEPFIMVDGTID
ncbi:ABC transporter ATP-binding protein [Novacetimonas hansenii]|uniref:ABC transporter ATP-binding protein n=1 Tax=Novacetimonas hansenii TaxID=436 RepID=UPI00094F6D28|nr:ABC transporter ATP-binding protein [Novacetimonas hansenii]MBL7236147.1 ABC transporter ATP-binding protein [Novacetimonas hansenii]QOF94336.1 ABC transporter ATP-binding protein [Novacetimonas hansenii]